MPKKLLLYSEITPESTSILMDGLLTAESDNDSVELRINSPGGSVLDGIAIYNFIKKSAIPINAYIDGVAASMASVIICACKRVGMSKYARVMIHQPSGGNWGKSEELRDTANILDSLEETITDIYSAKCQRDKAWVKDNWLDGKDHWLTANEALSYGLVDYIYDSEIVPPESIVSEKFYAFFKENLNNKSSKKETKSMKNLIMKVNTFLMLAKMDILPETASEEMIADKFKAISDSLALKESEITSLQAKLAVYQKSDADRIKAEIKALIDNAIKERKFTEKQRGLFESLADKDFESTKQAIEAMPSLPTINSLLGEDGDDERKDWSFDDYSKKDPKALETMKIEAPEKYKALLKKQYPNIK